MGSAAPEDGDGPVVSLDTGRIRGLRRDGDLAFLGVPVARPPVGPLRFAPPVPADRWEGVRPALRHGPTAQRAETVGPVPGLIPEPSVPGDDILTANVFTPSADPAARLPVLVWIHGGGYVAGSPASPWYDGAAFSREGIVTVVISYRLGFDGFGAIPGEPGNLAVRDWLLALDWVQRGIASFGGDPGRVTIAGQSAGGGAVLTLLGLPAASGLFRAAWASSPVLPVRTRESAEAVAVRLAARLGVAPTREALAAVPELRLIAAQEAAVRPPGRSSVADLVQRSPSYSPVVDGDLLVEPTFDTLRRGVGAGVELVVGSNDDELRGIAGQGPGWLRFVPAGIALRATGIGGAALRAYRAGLHADGIRGTAAELDRGIADLVFRRTVVETARARAAATRAYRFSWPSPVKGGAIHCLDVPFLWDVLGEEHVPALAGDAPPQALADALHGALGALVRGETLAWPRWDDDRGRIAILGGSGGTLVERNGGYDAVAPLLR